MHAYTCIHKYNIVDNGYLFTGLEACANEVPFRFIVKQLLVEKSRVIFTGTYIYIYFCVIRGLVYVANY